jgi:hypothetical protein
VKKGTKSAWSIFSHYFPWYTFHLTRIRSEPSARLSARPSGVSRAYFRLAAAWMLPGASCPVSPAASWALSDITSSFVMLYPVFER